MEKIMNIKVIEKSYDEISHINGFKYKKPKRRSLLFNYLIRVLSFTELKKSNFKYTMVNMDKLPKKPCLVLMNHSSFIDGKILFKILKSKKFNIVTARDSYIQKDLLMRTIGCIPTNKFMNDLQLIKDIQYCLNDLKSSVVLFPEAGYSFDGTKTVLPKSLGKLCKLLKVPVISIITSGAYTNNPLYNNLKRRKVDISAKVNLLFNEEDINNLSIDEINSKINNEFSFDAFKWQLENKIKITEDFRADSLNRILYKCPHCLTEGKMVGQGIELTCKHCGKTHILNEYGQLEGKDFTPIFSHIIT
jgi:1-acyl-sn-glycerol-3-phosphate acyltransferase